MLESIQIFFASVINAEFDFAAIWESLCGIWAQLICSTAYIEIEALVNGFLANVPAIAVTGVLLALSLIQLFAGKKLLGFQKFLACFAVGFVCGTIFLTPFISGMMPTLPQWVGGVVVGAIAALLCKPVYFLTYVFSAAYAMYFVCFTGAVLPEVTAFTVGNMTYSLIAAAVAVLLVLIFRKWIEMIGTSFLGAWCTFLCVDTLAGLTNMIPVESFDLVKWIAIGVVAFIGFIVQVKTRRRY